MSDGYGAAVDVQLCMIQPQFAFASQSLRGEGFVDLNPINLVEPQPTSSKNRSNGGNRADAHDLRRHADNRARNHLGERRLTVLAHKLPGGHQRGSSAVHDTRAVSAGLYSTKSG